MAIILRTAKHWLTYWGQLMNHDLHWPPNTWSVIIHRSLTKSNYWFWVVDWFEFPIWHIFSLLFVWMISLDFRENPQFWTWFSFWESRTLCDHKMPIFAFTKHNLLLKMGLSRSSDWLFVNSTGQLVIYPVNGKIFVFKWGFLPSPFSNG
jgi:hypothetical protein